MRPEAIAAAYRRSLGQFETIAIRRFSGTGPSRPYFDYTCLARVTDFQPDELAGNIQQGDRKVIVLAEDLVAAQFPAPVRKGDAIVVGGSKVLNIEAADDASRRVGARVIAYQLVARG